MFAISWDIIVALVVGIPAAVGVARLVAARRTSNAPDLGALRDEGAKRFCSRVTAELRRQAARGRSDYDFHFRRYDVCVDWMWAVGLIPIPVLGSYWDCIDSEGSRAVVRQMLQQDSGLRVEWCIHSKYPLGMFTPKWVLACRWDKMELRAGVFGGR